LGSLCLTLQPGKKPPEGCAPAKTAKGNMVPASRKTENRRTHGKDNEGNRRYISGAKVDEKETKTKLRKNNREPCGKPGKKNQLKG